MGILMGKTLSTQLKIVNDTSSTITTRVSGFKRKDWSGPHIPNKNLDDVRITPGSEYSREETIRARSASSVFTLAMSFSSGKRLTFRIDQGRPVDKKRCRLSHKEKNIFTFTGDVNAFEVTNTIAGNTLTIHVKDSYVYMMGDVEEAKRKAEEIVREQKKAAMIAEERMRTEKDMKEKRVREEEERKRLEEEMSEDERKRREDREAEEMLEREKDWVDGRMDEKEVFREDDELENTVIVDTSGSREALYARNALAEDKGRIEDDTKKGDIAGSKEAISYANAVLEDGEGMEDVIHKSDKLDDSVSDETSKGDNVEESVKDETNQGDKGPGNGDAVDAKKCDKVEEMMKMKRPEGLLETVL